MKDYMKEYEKWSNYQDLNQELYQELDYIKEQTKEIEERFYKDLEFGTGGLRGIISAGTNRMNIYTIRKATLGLANYIIANGEEAMNKGVVIAYDSRKYSREFAMEAAKVLAYQNIKVYLFNELKPTPLLSFAVRYLKAFSGIVITASHNPSEYNGYKVYNQYGGQITEEAANRIYDELQRIHDMLTIPVADYEQAIREEKIVTFDNEIDLEYIKHVKDLLLNKELMNNEGHELSIVYTPLHGTGRNLVKKILGEIGFSHLQMVKEQELPDPNFSTVTAPNPEDIKVFDLAIEYANKQDADIIMATDPDADRLGVLVKVDGEYQALNGNQLGALVLHYLLQEKSAKGQLPENSRLVKTIVTSELGAVIAKNYDVAVDNTLTGFKYIGEKIKEYKETGKGTFIFGYEESYGYLAGDFVRDKDAVQITAIVAEMALVYKKKGKTLFDVLEDIYKSYGYYVEDLESITLKGIEGSEKIKQIVSFFRENPPKEVNGTKVKWFEDYLESVRKDFITQEITGLAFPKSNVIKMILEDQSWIAIRPSGTEPKIKFYFGVVSDSFTNATEKLHNLKASVMESAKEHM